MAHCPSCNDPDCQGADHRCEVVIDEDEFKKLLDLIKGGLNNRGSIGAINLAKSAVATLEGYNKNGLNKDRVDGFGNRY